MNDYATTRAAEARQLTTAAALVCGLVLAVLAVRGLARRARDRREDRADALTAARWRAQHAPHLLDAHDRAQLARIGHPPALPVPAAAVEGLA